MFLLVPAAQTGAGGVEDDSSARIRTLNINLASYLSIVSDQLCVSLYSNLSNGYFRIMHHVAKQN